MPLIHVPVAPLPPARFRELLGERYVELEEAIARAASSSPAALSGTSTRPPAAAASPSCCNRCSPTPAAPASTRAGSWSEANPEFFRVTKRIHNNLHGAAGDGGSLGDDEHEVYEETLARGRGGAGRHGRFASDIVFLHDPQTAGLVEPIRETGATVVWRCHVGLDLPNDLARQAWDFLRAYVEEADAYVFSREEFVWEGLDTREGLDRRRRRSTRSRPRTRSSTPETVARSSRSPACATGGDVTRATFTREDGTPGRVDRAAQMFQDEPIPDDAPAGHAGLALGPPQGPDRGGRSASPSISRHPVRSCCSPARRSRRSADDPEGAEVLAEVDDYREELEPADAQRGCTWPRCRWTTSQENAAIVNAHPAARRTWSSRRASRRASA